MAVTSIPKCACCTIPLPLYCSRNKLSSKLSTTFIHDLSFYEAINLVFKCRKSVVSRLGSALRDLELCRYCSLNIIRLVKYYNRIVKIATETGSVLSKLLCVQSSKLAPADKRHLDEPDREASTKDSSDSQFVDDESNSEEVPPGLTYLGLVRKKRKRIVEIFDDEDHFDDDDRANDDLRVELLVPELSLTEATSKGKDGANSSSDPDKHSASSPSSYKCQHCSKTFCHSQRLSHHVKTHHEELSSQEEPKKGRKRASKSKVTVSPAKRGRPPRKEIVAQSSAETTKEKSKASPKKSPKKDETVCKICKKKFKHVQFLKQHMRVHSNDKRCPQCEKKFKSAALLKRHMQIHEKDNNSAFKCEDCGREFPNLLGLQVHAVTHTRTLYTCKGCKRKFKIEKNFIQHQETARCTEKKHACPTCGKLFKNKDKVKRHLISMHSETKPFTCNSCGKGFRSQADLNFHEVNAHICGETKQFQCEQCGKRFKSHETLKSHEMYSHKMEKKHFCQTCGKGFPLLATLKIHEISHSDIRPYMCTYCGRTYKHANDLKSHEVVHYKDEEKPFVCPICGLRYHRKDVLRLHQTRERHFGPDVPVPTSGRRQPEGSKSKRSNQNPTFRFEDLVAEEEPVHSSDSSMSNSNPAVVVSHQVGSNSISVIQAVNPHLNVANFPTQSQATIQGNANNLIATANSAPHVVPILQTSTLTLAQPQQQQQQQNTTTVVAAPAFNVTVTPVNEAITDFYRIMYDLA